MLAAFCRPSNSSTLLGIFLMLTAGSVAAQTPAPPADHSWQMGYRGFEMLVEDTGMSVVTDAEEALNLPESSAVVVSGRLNRMIASDWLRLRRFVAQGGALLVIGEEACEISGVTTLKKGPVTTSQPDATFSGYNDVLQIPVRSQASLSQGVSTIVANRSGWLMRPRDQSLRWEVVAATPADSQPTAAAEAAILLCGYDDLSQSGVFIICADHSLLSDGMLWYGDNAILAIRIAEALGAGDRERCVFLRNGRIQNIRSEMENRGAPPIPPSRPPIPPPSQIPEEPPNLETLIRRTNEFLDLLQRSNLANEWLKDRPGSVGEVRWLRLIVFLGALLGCLLLLWRAFRQFRPLLPEWKKRVMKSMYQATAADQIAKAEFGSAAEVLCRSFCRELSGSVLESDWLMLRSKAAQTTSAAELPGRLRRGLDEIVSIAVRGTAVTMPRKRFEELGKSMRELRLRNQQTRLIRSDHLSSGAASAMSPIWSRTRP